ncbi:MAG: hypothetical protein RLY19_936 [Actinomycetota bacterium]|jgi:hypothetical protein
MNNDDHLDSDQLTPSIIAALRDVSPANDAVRDQQIATALSHLGVEARAPRRPWLAAVAASVVLLGGGVIIGRSISDSKSTYASASPSETTTTLAAKGDLGASTTLAPTCAARAGGTYIGSYSAKGQRWQMYVSDSTLNIVNHITCEVASRTPLPTIP